MTDSGLQNHVRKASEAHDSLRATVNEFVGELFEDFAPPPKADARKMLRDAVHHFTWIRPEEVPVLDSPLVQRLRYIKQTAFADYLYPSANHTRFSHSVGVAHMATRICAGLNESGFKVDDTDKNALRLAGLLHDIGHCFLSHLSERTIDEHFGDPFTALSAAPTEFPHFAGKKTGEILSYLMITSPPMAELISTSTNLDASVIGGLVLGKGRTPQVQWMGDVISGPFDADKLDYLARDCYSTGIRAEVDTEHIVNGLALADVAGDTILAGTPGIVSNLEQIVAAKVQLYFAVYHHHKVRALECMVRGAVDFARENPDEIQQERFRFRSLVDVLRMTDPDFFQMCTTEPALKSSIGQMFRSRRILKRALALTWDTFQSNDASKSLEFEALAELEQRAEVRELRQAIVDSCDKLGSKDIHWLWLDVPTPPTLDDDTALARIVAGEEVRTLNDYFPTPNWMKSYGEFRETSHIFAWPDKDLRRSVSESAQTLLRDRFDFEIYSQATDCIK